jgi:RNA polymerase sigma factor (sigma-70 family)
MNSEGSGIHKASDQTGKAVVYIVDDDDDVRRSLALLVQSVHLMPICFGSAAEFLESFSGDQTGCILVDLRMPGISGLELQRRLQSMRVHMPIIFMSAYGDISTVSEVMRAGAVDFITKPFNPQILLERINEAIATDSERRTADIHRQDVQHRLERLTEREREIMQLLANGCSTKTIAARLDISTKTVDNHRAKILEKMEVENPAQLARLILGSDESSLDGTS